MTSGDPARQAPRRSTATAFSRRALIAISCVAVVVVAAASSFSTALASLACIEGAGFCAVGGLEKWMPLAMILGPPIATAGFGVASVRGGRFTPIAAGAILCFVVGVATPALVTNA